MHIPLLFVIRKFAPRRCRAISLESPGAQRFGLRVFSLGHIVVAERFFRIRLVSSQLVDAPLVNRRGWVSSRDFLWGVAAVRPAKECAVLPTFFGIRSVDQLAQILDLLRQFVESSRHRLAILI